jgi:hypothetical protein
MEIEQVKHNILTTTINIDDVKVKDLKAPIWFHIMGYMSVGDDYDVSVIALALTCKALNTVYQENKNFIMPVFLDDGFQIGDCFDFRGYSVGAIYAFDNYHEGYLRGARSDCDIITCYYEKDIDIALDLISRVPDLFSEHINEDTIRYAIECRNTMIKDLINYDVERCHLNPVTFDELTVPRIVCVDFIDYIPVDPRDRSATQEEIEDGRMIAKQYDVPVPDIIVKYTGLIWYLIKYGRGFTFEMMRESIEHLNIDEEEYNIIDKLDSEIIEALYKKHGAKCDELYGQGDNPLYF